ncbi:colicin E1 family microcin immunity protein [Pseudomonas chlororaphis]|uniref:colicin E1 family microcin immunity protein n=1 Tax=Pseudomonas chlororaphis TaxID=587753 RepID=UPI0014764E99|nr:colicin E1 family microcin immunity protein [Pseudomonas chlororaphis]NNB42282.1 hypothetical protein [Pseudomonas chlororaphis]
MDKKYFIKHLLKGCLYLVAVCIAWYVIGDEDLNEPWLLVFMILSTLLYPFSRYLLQESAYRVTNREFWKKGFFIEDVNSPRINALFSFFCMVFAIPLGASYLVYQYCKKG